MLDNTRAISISAHEAPKRVSPVRFGVQAKLGLSVLLAALVSGLFIATTLDLFGKDRVYRANLEESRAMVKAISLTFAQGLSHHDEILLDALVHELQSRKDLHIKTAYVLDMNGRVVAHSNTAEYGKHYPLPALLREKEPSRLSQVIASGAPTFKVVSLLQAGGQTLGALVVRFSTEQLAQRLHSELVWVIGTTLPIFLITGVGLLLFGRNMVKRLVALRAYVLSIGRGEWGTPVAIHGNDEITSLSIAFNQMRQDLVTLAAKDRASTETISDLNRELNAQLHTVEQLKEQLAEENADLRRRLKNIGDNPEFIGRSKPVHQLLEQAKQTAPLPINVLITGESGTGKELLANFLHKHGERASSPFIKVNCAALPTTLIESELFGHEKGAFTGATSQRKGKFEQAHGGTLFLDEIGELPLESQSKLLRALQQNEIQRIGGNAPITVDVRLVTATNRNLADEVNNGRFREDLYYRLKVIELHSPALREHIDDLPILAQHFIEHFSTKLGRTVIGISPSALEKLSSYSWPGNVRELEHAIARAVALTTTQVLGPDDFNFLVQAETGSISSTTSAEKDHTNLITLLKTFCKEKKPNSSLWEQIHEVCERACLDDALSQARNQKEAASLLGISPTKMHRLVRKYGVKRS